jgi:hypothetical protein
MLCLALVAGGSTMAVARGHAAALSGGGTSIVICTGYGVMTITLDDAGNPVGPVYPCPDCLAGLATYLGPGLVAPAPITRHSDRAIAVDAPHFMRFALALIHRARGPPLLG